MSAIRTDFFVGRRWLLLEGKGGVSESIALLIGGRRNIWQPWLHCTVRWWAVVGDLMLRVAMLRWAANR